MMRYRTMKLALLLCAAAIFTVASTTTKSESSESTLNGKLLCDNVPTLNQVVVCAFLGLVSWIIYEQVSLAKKRGSLPGPRFSIPFIGSLVELVHQLYIFWINQES
jgi:hypothetical protein